MRTGLDYSWSRPTPDAIAASGASFVARYHSADLRTSGGVPKILTRTEAAGLSAVGLDIVSVWEGKAADRDPLKGYAQGRVDGDQALRQAAACGAPPGVVIYYAVDWDATDGQMPTIAEYFTGVADAHGGPETVGVYGSHAVVRYLMSMGRTGYGWQTYAWSQGRWHEPAQLRQVRNDQRLLPSGRVGSAADYPAGAAVDLDEAHAEDFGQWRITMTYAPDDLKAVQAYSHSVCGLGWPSLGVVGDTSHNSSGGYHVGKDVLHSLGTAPEDQGSDYSYTESVRDRAGLTNAASAFDQGDFEVIYKGRRVSHHMLIDAVLREVAKPGRGRCKDVREMIYEVGDGTGVIRRWDALGKRNTGDSSHGSHTHFSFFRDSEGRRDDPDNFLGLMREVYEPQAAPTPTPPPATGDDDMGCNTPPIVIAADGNTSLTTIVASGSADPRPHWLRITNDTQGVTYALRVWWGNGKGGWGALELTGHPDHVKKTGDGIYTVESNWTLSGPMPKGCEVVTISRQPTGTGAQPYTGNLTCMFERGAPTT